MGTPWHASGTVTVAVAIASESLLFARNRPHLQSSFTLN
jgi:hypothetical protein